MKEFVLLLYISSHYDAILQFSFLFLSVVPYSLRSSADCYPLLEVPDMLLMGDHPDPMCVFTYVQALCQSLTKIEKQRKDKEKEEGGKAAEEGGEKGEEEAQEPSREKDEGEAPENGTRDSPEGKGGEGAEREGAGEEEEEEAQKSCEVKGDGGVSVEAES